MEKAENIENPGTEGLETAEGSAQNTDQAEKEAQLPVPEADDPPAPDADNNNYPSQTVLTIRAIVGGYVMYLAYQIITSDSELTPLMWAAVILFIVAGAGLIIMSVKHFICKEYK
ncbi:MAG: hypothetical protein K6G58_00300 [Lachnospiraceae bacterium]|nr:hypothetical protein [Lachnospiraceae bacterium]